MVHVIFDMDGVIFDSERTLLECWIDTAQKYDVDEDLIRNFFLRCIGLKIRQTKEFYTDAFLDLLGEEKMWLIWNESYELHKKKYSDGVFPLKAGVKEILEYLRTCGISAGIASSSTKQTVDQRISRSGLAEYFVGSIGGDTVKNSKPDPEIYLLACDTFGFDPVNTFAIEDSFNGIRAASAAGLRPVMVPDIVPADSEMKRLSEIVCKDLFEVVNYLAGFLIESEHFHD